MKAWNFVSETLRDSRPIPADGEWLEHDGELDTGVQASVRLIDALLYARGSTICRVELGGEIIEGDDKVVATRRRILWRVDGEELLREFARWCALEVIHLWNAPDVVREYLETGDEELREAAWEVACQDVRETALDLPGAMAREAARDAATPAAWSAARYAAWGAAGAVAWDAVSDTVWEAVSETERNAAMEAAWLVKRAEQDARLSQRVHALLVSA